MLAAFVAVTALLGRRHGFPTAPPLAAGALRRAVVAALPALLIPAVLTGTIFGGLATPTEAGAFACLATLAIGRFGYREMRLADLWPAALSAVRASSAVLMLIAAATLAAWVATMANLPATLAAALGGATQSPIIFLLLVNLLLLALGTVCDPIPALILTVPVLLPVATDTYGIDPVRFGVITCLNLTLGLLTPPVGSGLYAAALVGNVPPERIARLMLPFAGAVALILLALVFVPALTL